MKNTCKDNRTSGIFLTRDDIHVFKLFFRVLLGRSHIKAVAENRRMEIERFLQELLSGSAEVTHVSLVEPKVFSVIV